MLSEVGVGGFKPPTCPLFRVRFKVLGLPLLGLSLSIEQRGPDAQFLQFVHQITILVHLEQDVAASYELAVEVDLRDRGPVGELLDSCGRKKHRHESGGKF